MQPITFRLELEGMKQQIIHAFTSRQLELADILDKEITKAFETLDFDAIVREQIKVVVPEIVKRSMERVVHDMLWDVEYKELLKQMAQRAIDRHLREDKAE